MPRLQDENQTRIQYMAECAAACTACACIVCGKPIEQSLRFHTCSDTCATTLNTITSDIRKQRYKKLRKQGGRVKPPKPMSKLGQSIAEARALGMEYGEYMAMRYMKGE